MNLNKKTLIYLGGIVTGLALLFSLLFYFIVVQSIQDIETTQVEKSMARAKAALSSELITLQKTALTWSEWDDTFEYVKGNNPGFVNKYITTESLNSLDANIVGFINKDDQVVLLREYDATKDIYVTASDEKLKAIIDTHKALKTDSMTKGFMNYGGKPMMVTFNNITRSDASGPSDGIFLLGQIIDDEALAGLSSVVQAEMEVKLVENATTEEEEYAEAFEYLDSDDHEIFIDNEGAKVAGFSYFKDITKKPIIIAEVESPRDMFININRNYVFFLIIALTGMVGCAALMYRYIKLNILDRVNAISEFLEVNAHDSNFSARIKVQGTDEIAALETSLNKIIDSSESCKRSK